jgi:hypothetical protein
MDNISVTLPVQAWNSILNALGARPFTEVADLIAEIKRQANAQVVTTLPSATTESPEISAEAV